uniref:Uncharacterized protein n=1 Tax=Setaria italica TaxID=4555 RepID=A0A0Q3VBE4_SETIT
YLSEVKMSVNDEDPI